IPVYNAEKTIEQTVKSVISQLDFYTGSLEIIIIDDGSKDNSYKLCEDFCASDYLKENARLSIKCKHIKNSGVSNARNIGIEQASGKYLMFVDADDTLEADALKYMYEAMNNVSDDIAFVTMASDGETTGIITGTEYINTKLLYKDTHVWGKLFKREALSGVRFQDGLTIGEDMLFLLELAIKYRDSRCIRCLPEQKYIYTDNAEGAMKREFKPSYIDQLTCWQLAEKTITEQGIALEDKSKIRLSCIQIMAAMLLVGKLSQIKENKKDEIQIDLVVADCKKQIKESLKIKGTFAALEAGYKVKVLVFLLSQKLYMRSYGNWKK
ncbi:glycosyltransferase family 2 protein, partial [Butyrivibrio sp.]|uniref:glycosyltransferase family 2 protein n=1 Tax=Butyrivibrio sp. TaxID=28121 RepID=UPI0025C4BB08